MRLLHVVLESADRCKCAYNNAAIYSYLPGTVSIYMPFQEKLTSALHVGSNIFDKRNKLPNGGQRHAVPCTCARLLQTCPRYRNRTYMHDDDAVRAQLHNNKESCAIIEHRARNRISHANSGSTCTSAVASSSTDCLAPQHANGLGESCSSPAGLLTAYCLSN